MKERIKRIVALIIVGILIINISPDFIQNKVMGDSISNIKIKLSSVNDEEGKTVNYNETEIMLGVSKKIIVMLETEGENVLNSEIRYATDLDVFKNDTYDNIDNNGVNKIESNLEGKYKCEIDGGKINSKQKYYFWCYNNAKSKSEVATISIIVDTENPNIKSEIEEIIWLNDKNELVNGKKNELINGENNKKNVIYVDEIGRINFNFYMTDNGYSGLSDENIVFKISTNDGVFDKKIRNFSCRTDKYGYTKANCNFVFDENIQGKYLVYVLDGASNKSNELSFEIGIDKDSPTIEVDNESYIGNSSVNITGKVFDYISENTIENSGISEVRYSTELEIAENDSYFNNDIDKIRHFENDKFSLNITSKDTLETTYYIWAYDRAGNKSKIKAVKVFIDNDFPTIDVEGITNIDENVFMLLNKDNQLINKNTGEQLVSNDILIEDGEIKLNIHVKDKGFGGFLDYFLVSKINNQDNRVSIKSEMKEVNEEKNIQGNISYIIDSNKTGSYTLYVEDAVYTKSNPIIFDYLIDTVHPTVEIEQYSYKSNEAITIKGIVKDEGENGVTSSGIKEVRYSTELEVAENDNYFSNQVEQIIDLTNENFSIEVTSEKSLKTTYYVWAYDNAGNKSEIASIEVIIDKECPVITNLENEEDNKISLWINKNKEIISSETNEIITYDFILLEDGSNEDLNLKINIAIKDIGFGGLTNGYLFWSKNGVSENKYKILNSEESTDAYGNSLMNIDCILSGTETGTYKIWVQDATGNESDEIIIEVNYPQIEFINEASGQGENQYKEVNKEKITIGVKEKIGAKDVCDVRYSFDEQIALDDSYEEYADEVNVKNAIKDDVEGYYIGIESKASLSETIYIWAYDEAGNKSNIISREIIIDRDSPVIENYKIGNYNSVWTKEDVTVSFNCTDKGGSAYINVYYALKEDYEAYDEGNLKLEEGLNNNIIKEITNYNNVYSVEFKEEQNKNYVFWVIDEAGNSSKKEQAIKIDKTAPVIKSISIEKTDDTFKDVGIKQLRQNINKLPFGLFYNSSVSINIYVEDRNEGTEVWSGINIDSIRLYNKDDELIDFSISSYETNVGQSTAEIKLVIKPTFKNGIYVYVEDYSSNYAKLNISSSYEEVGGLEGVKDIEGLNGDEKYGLIHLENSKPIVSAKANGENECESWFSGNVEFNISAEDLKTKDMESGISYIYASIIGTDYEGNTNDKYVTWDNYDGKYFNESQTWCVKNNIISTDDILDKDGKYVLTYYAVDNAGNESEKETITVNIDTEKPEISKFEFISDKYNEVEERILTQEDNYGYYYQSDVKVKITAKDEKHSSGIKSITYYTKSIEGEIGKEEIVNVNENNQIEITIQSGFKGYIYAIATDNVNNSSEPYVTTWGIISETQEKHNETGRHINIELPKTDKKDTEGKALYNSDINIPVTVSDINTGIRKIEWSITSPYDTSKNASGVIEINNDKTYVDGSDTGWTQKSIEKNLVTEMTKTFNVSNNSNDIVLKIKITDRAGNISEDAVEFSIDKTIPTYTIFYDNNEADVVYTDFYNKNRTATIVVTERNFNEKDFITTITNTDNVLPKVSDFKPVVDTNNPDNNTYTVTIEYTEDGDYEFDMQYTDMAGNPAKKFEKETFTIDKTLPEISVSYDNNSAINENYYKEDRKATITITEHNFDPSRVKIIGTVTRDGVTTEFPTKDVSWSSDGDIHTAYINYTEDGLYIFDIGCSDKAGNSAEDFEKETFTIDKTLPEISVDFDNDSASNGNYYNADRTAKLVITEHNFNSLEVNIIGTVTRNGVTTEFPTKDVSWSSDGDIHTAYINYIEDGLYTLEIEYTDKAGNPAEDFEKETFTIDKTLPEISVSYDNNSALNGNYYSEKRTANITINEHNFDPSRVKIIGTVTKNGVTTAFPTEELNWSSAGDIHTVYINYIEDGLYTFDIECIDKAGNQSIDFEKQTFTIDKTLPEISVSYNNNSALNENYYKAERTATITIREHNFEPSEVRIIGTVTKNGVTTSLPAEIAWSSNGDIHTSKINYNNEGVYTFDIEYTDKAGNPAKDFEKQTFIIDKTMPEISVSYDNNSALNGNYYSEKRTATITIKERNFDSSIVRIIGTATDKGEAIQFPTLLGWTSNGDVHTAVINYTEDGLYTFDIEYNDMAGNSAKDFEKQTFTIDKTMPEVSVSYDNNSALNENYYSEDRIATITINEHNFDPSEVKIIGSVEGNGTGELFPSISAWTSNGDVHTAVINYTTDGLYSFDIECSDKAGNPSADFTAQTFTIDKTLPEISVSYNNNSSINGNYYKAERRATITINEHNFDASGVRIIGSATDNGATISFPAESSWSSNGDIHTAVIDYTADGLYSFDIEYSDKAGNAAVDYNVEQFYVDKTMPEVKISGVANNSANNGDVVPVINFGDINYNAANTVISLRGVNSGTREFDGEFENGTNGQIFTFKNIEAIQENDDIYILTATTTDMAGNETTDTITFSVNRFGSVYTIDDSVKEISNKFIKSTEDIIITETNVDSLDMDKLKIRMTKNGTPYDLIVEQDFTIEMTGGNGQWCQYKYRINKDLFTDDGTYIIAIYSVDAAGNVNENDEDSKKAEISFGIDNTKPVIIPIDIEKGKSYDVNSKTVNINVKDNLLLGKVRIFLNGKEVEFVQDGENYSFEMSSSNKKQAIKIIAEDAAGNVEEIELDGILISANAFVRWYNDRTAVALTISGIVVLTGFIILIIFIKKKKTKEESKSQQ